MTEKDPIQCTEAELRAMTRDLDEMHHATFPQLRDQLGDLASSLRGDAGKVLAHSTSRRGFLLGSGLAVGGVALAACGGGSTSSTSTPSPGKSSASAAPTQSSSGAASGDVAGLATNASLENLAVFAYNAALTAPAGKFGTIPPAVVGFAMHAKQQHSDHANAFNAALQKAGHAPFTEPDPALAPTIQAAFAKISTVPDLAKLALGLENTAAETYTKQMGEFTSSDALGAVATIAPVERQHAAILNFVLGQYPVPKTFVPLDLARPSSDAGV